MLAILSKELGSFFSSLVGYIVIGVFLLVLGVILFVFPDTSLLDYQYATLDPLFSTAPLIFAFLIPAITMRSFAEEHMTGAMELLITKPLSDWQIVLGKYLACLLLVGFALLPTLLYYITVYQLGSPKGNLDAGAIAGSYIGLFLLGACFTAIGLFASSLSQNQIVAFILASVLCFIFYWGFYYISNLPVFVGKTDDLIQKIGIDYHYTSISRGVLDSRDIIYFLSVMVLFLSLTKTALDKRNW